VGGFDRLALLDEITASRLLIVFYLISPSGSSNPKVLSIWQVAQLGRLVRKVRMHHRHSQGAPMLRITIEEKGKAVVLRLEGQLIGPWIADVEQCCKNVFATLGHRTVQVDLSAVSFVDDEGGALLSRMHNAGFRLESDGLLRSMAGEEGDPNWRMN
jgi:hypothetical protein